MMLNRPVTEFAVALVSLNFAAAAKDVASDYMGVSFFLRFGRDCDR